MSHGVVVSALRCGRENPSSSPPWTLNLMTNAVAICQIGFQDKRRSDKRRMGQTSDETNVGVTNVG